ncbi:unnamed protein product [Lota lota]
MLSDSSAEMQAEGQASRNERPLGQRGDRPQTGPRDAESPQPAGEDRPARGSPSVGKGVGTGAGPSEPNRGAPVKMQSLLHQVRGQIRSQAGLTGAKTGLSELVRQLKDREAELASLTGRPEEDGGSGAGAEARGAGGGATPTNGERGKTGPEATEPLLPSGFEEELEATRNTLRGEFEQQISRLRVEMRVYADRAVKDMESKMKHTPVPHGQAKGRSRERTEGKAAVDKKQKPLAAAAAAPPSLTSRRSRVLTRTMTTIVPKTCAPVILGPRAKSESLSGCRDGGSLLMKESDFRVFRSQGSGSRQPHNRRALPPVHQQAVHPRQKPIWTTAQTSS